MEKENESVFAVLSAIDCSGHVEKKTQAGVTLSYLSWAWAWHIAKEHYPGASYTIYETPEGIPYFTDGRTAWVKTGVTIEGQEYIEYLPVMDYRNQSIPVEKLTSFDMNKAIQRSLTKALARHGLGLYIYAGEDLPTEPEKVPENPVKPARKASPAPAPQRDLAKREWPAGEKLAKWVEAIAKGALTKSGVPAREAFIGMFAPDELHLAALDEAVMDYKINNNLK